MNAMPPKLAPKPAGLRLAVMLIGGTAVCLGALVFFFNPATHHFYPICQFHRLTGLNCPGCGMTRALYAVLHGQFAEALQDNALLPAVLAGTILRGVWLSWNRRQGKRTGAFFPARLLWPLLLVVLIFTVLRNLSAFSFLSPANA